MQQNFKALYSHKDTYGMVIESSLYNEIMIVDDKVQADIIGQLHDDITLPQLPESLSFLFSCAN